MVSHPSRTRTYLQSLGADYANFKATLGATPIFCLLADKREWRFYSVDFETRPFTVQRADVEVPFWGKEGSLPFLIQIKTGKVNRSFISIKL